MSNAIERERDAWKETARLYATNADYWRDRAEGKIRVRRSGLMGLLRSADTGGFWSRALGIGYKPGSDVPIEVDYDAIEVRK